MDTITIEIEHAMTTPPPALIFGCGYLGTVVARMLLAQGRNVFALTRGRNEILHSIGVSPIVGDVLDCESLKPLADLPYFGLVVYCVGYDRRAGRSMREVYVDGVANATACGRLPLAWIHVSSTGVYGQTDGSIVDEESPTLPLEESGRIVLEAEAVVRSNQPLATILRFAGIYGPGRVLRRDALLRGDPLSMNADGHLNLIHVDDGARAILASQTRGACGKTLNICDDTPSTRRMIYTETARLLSAPPATFVPPSVPTVEADRRISNAKAKRVLGWSPTYPSYREGLVASLS